MKMSFGCPRALALVVLLCLVCLQGVWAGCPLGQHQPSIDSQEDEKVAIELFVMSRCPDALRAEARFDEVLAIVHPIATIRLHYIATLNGPFVECKHGEPECKGNVQQLCVSSATDDSLNYDGFWKFIMCQHASPERIGDLPLAEECLAQLPAPVAESSRRCMNGWGPALLLKDVKRTVALDVAKSCTIFIDHKKRCVHDGGEWYDCPGGSEVEDFVQSVCNAYLAKTGAWPDLCAADRALPRRI